MKIKKNGIYLLKEEFFNKYDVGILMNNKNSRRPHFYVITDKYDENIYWVVPMTSKIEKVKKNIEKFKKIGKTSPYYVLNKTSDNSAFNVGNTFPIINKYFESEYIDKTSKKHVVIKNKETLKELNYKTKYIINQFMKSNNFIQVLYKELTLELKKE